MICHFSNMTYFILILLHYHFDICLFVSSRALFRDSVMFVTRFSLKKKRASEGGSFLRFNFILILLHYHFDIYLFLSSRALFRDSVMFVTRFSLKKKRASEGGLFLRFDGPFLGSCCDFYLITFIQRPSMRSLLLRRKHY